MNYNVKYNRYDKKKKIIQLQGTKNTSLIECRDGSNGISTSYTLEKIIEK